MQVPELANKLQRLGFEPDEATVYIRLLQNGPSRASTLASLCDMNRTKIYRVLDDLVDDRYATASVGRPTIYRAQDPEEVFGQLREDVKAKQRTLDRVQDDVLDPLKNLSGEDHEVMDPDWKLIEGYPRIYETLNRCLRDVSDRIVLVSNHAITTNLLPFVEEAWESATEKARQGVAFEAMLGNNITEGDRVQRWSKEANVQVRTIDVQESLHYVLLDDERVLQWLVMETDDSVQMDKGAAILSNAPGLVTTTKLLAARLWEEATPLPEDP